MSPGNRFKKMIIQRQIIKSMAIKNLKSKYIGSSLGILWAIINPLLTMLVITFVFTKIMKIEIRHFPLFVLSALLPWGFFASSISESATSMVSNAELLNRFIMLREVIPISIAFANFINFLFGFVVIMPLFVIFNPVIIKYVILLPFIISLHFIFTLGISLLFSIINVYFKDLQQLLGVVLMFLFWLTPVFYSIEMIPQKYHWFIMANPNSCYVIIYRALLYNGSFGRMWMWLLAIVFALVSIISGYYLFITKESEILKYI
jgi:ABC-2 type transport system permease protein